MKKVIGFTILLIAFIVFTGCTQQPVQEPVTTMPTTVSTPVPTPVPTTQMTLVKTMVPTTLVTTVLPTATRTDSPINKLVTTVYMRNNSFVPQVLVALPGSGITWINNDAVPHSLKMSGSDGRFFNSGDIMPGSVYGYTFGKTEGNYTISDTRYPDMTGTIVIKMTSSVIV
jgi:plastocyanin